MGLSHAFESQNGHIIAFELPMTKSLSKLVHLECARGIASIIVVFHHFSLAFLPSLKETIMHGGVKNTPFYILLNGQGAVSFFFTLSGFVLTVSTYRAPSISKTMQALSKRLPRLALPAAVTIFISLAILTYHANFNVEASQISGSLWLHNYGGANFPEDFQPSFAGALQQSLFVFLFPKNFFYNSNLWTMRAEFFGSILVFLLSWAVMVPVIIRNYGTRAAHVVHITLIAILFLFQFAKVEFVIGSYLAFMFVRNGEKFTFGKPVNFLLFTLMVIGYSTLNRSLVPIASTALMLFLLSDNRISSFMSGHWGALIGKLSFPLYLVHTLVIMTLSSFVFVWLKTHGLENQAVIFTLFVTLLGALTLSLPFMVLESWWVPFLNRKLSSSNLSLALRRR